MQVDLQRVRDYSLSLYDERSGMFRFSGNADSTILSTCFGVQLLYLLGTLDSINVDRISSVLAAAQGEQGFFVDKELRPEELVGEQDVDYFRWQTTFFATVALDMLGKQPEHGSVFLDRFRDNDILTAWLEERNWGNFWYSSNEIMFLLYMLTFNAMQDEATNVLLWMDDHQKHSTGFWGTGDVRNQLYGAAHILLFYEYYDRKINFAETMAAATLRLADKAGLYGGACEDYDAVDVICRARGWQLHKQERAVLKRARDSICRAQRSDGGFPYRIVDPGIKGYVRKFTSSVAGHNRYLYSGWSKMSSSVYESDMWGTYFRALSIALIDEALGRDSCYCGYGLPGWGYIRSKSKTERTE